MNLRNLLPVLVFMFFGTVLFGQQFSGGLIGGLSTSEISGDRLTGPNKAGIYAGGFVNTYISKKSSFQMELNYIQKGSRKNPDTLDNSNFYLLRLNYVELFMHYKWDFAERFTFEAGPSYGILLKSYEETDGQILTGPTFKSGDLSGNVGLFFSLTQRWRFNVRYSNSILAVRPHSNGQTYKWNRGQYNEVLSFTLHYKL